MTIKRMKLIASPQALPVTMSTQNKGRTFAHCNKWETSHYHAPPIDIQHSYSTAEAERLSQMAFGRTACNLCDGWRDRLTNKMEENELK